MAGRSCTLPGVSIVTDGTVRIVFRLYAAPGFWARARQMRKFLYSRWFFFWLAIVCVVDLVADLSEDVWGWTDLNIVSIAMDVIAAGLALWTFVDLQRRKPKDGGDSRR